MGVHVRDAKELLRKADIAISDLVNDGGYLVPEQAKSFIRKLIKRSVIMEMATVIPMAGPTRRIEKIGFTSRILRKGTSATALDAGDRVKPALSKQELTTKLIKAEAWIPDEVLEDNIEKDGLQKTILQEMSKRAGLDLDELFLLGDTNSIDTYLALLDGMIVATTSNVYDAAGALIAKDVLKAAWKTMPVEYREQKSKMKFLSSSDAVAEYADQLGDRGTAAGDKAAIEGMAPKWQGVPVDEIPVMPQNIGTGSVLTAGFLTNPKNITIGIQRKIRTRWDTDIRQGVIYVVMDMRLDFQWAEEEAVVLIENLAWE